MKSFGICTHFLVKDFVYVCVYVFHMNFLSRT